MDKRFNEVEKKERQQLYEKYTRLKIKKYAHIFQITQNEKIEKVMCICTTG
jgi:hypothetical protein